MFDIMKYAETNHVEVDVRRGTKPVAWEFFLRDRSMDIVKFTQITEIDLKNQIDVEQYLKQRCDVMMEEISAERKLGA